MKIFQKAYLALLATVLLWSFLVIIAKGVAASIGPMTILSIRLFIASLFFLPFFLKNRVWRKKEFKRLVAGSLLTASNFVFFMWGIQFTSASTSQILYAAIPILILIVNALFFTEKYPKRKVIGVLLGFAGILTIVYLSAIEKGTTITGSLIGNLSILIAVFCWMSYILFSKRMSRYFSPTEIGSVSIITAFFPALILALAEIFILKTPVYLTGNLLLAAFYMGFFGTFLTYLLHQYAIKYTSALTVSLTSYIQPITTTILAMVFLGEKLTVYFGFGSVLVFFGIFLATTLEIYHRRKKV